MNELHPTPPTTWPFITPAGMLYAIERYGNEYEAAHYAPVGKPGRFAPVWRRIEFTDYQKLYDDNKRYESHREGNIRFYDLELQILNAIDARLEWQREVDETHEAMREATR